MKRSSYKKVHFIIPVVLWSAFIFYLSSLQFKDQGNIPGLDKIVHFIEYFVLSMLVYRMIFGGIRIEKKMAGYFTLSAIIIFAVSDEFHQSFVPTREVSLFDILSDTIGATAAIFFIWKLLPKVPKKLFSLAKKSDLI